MADSQIRSIILYVAEKFGNDVALQKLNDLEKGIFALADNPDIGVEPRYLVLRRQGYKVLISVSSLFYISLLCQNPLYLMD